MYDDVFISIYEVFSATPTADSRKILGSPRHGSYLVLIIIRLKKGIPLPLLL